MSFLTFALSRQPEMYVIRNFIENSLFLNELSSNLAQVDRIERKEICKQIYSSEPNFLYYFLQTRKIRLRFWSFFSQTPVKNQVTMAKA